MSEVHFERWLDQNFSLKFYPSPFLEEVQDLIKGLIREVDLEHPLWTKESSFRVKEIKIYVDDLEVFDNAIIEYEPKFELVLLEIGLANMIKNGCEEKYYGRFVSHREALRAEMIDVDMLKAQLFHEFGHPLDQTNPKFHYAESTNLSDRQACLVMCLWNAYIDGRISRATLPTRRDLESRQYEAYLCGASKIDKESVKKSVAEVWNRNEITYKELVEIARKEIPCVPESERK